MKRVKKLIMTEHKHLNPELPIEERLEHLMTELTLEEKAALLRFDSPAIERLGIPEYNWWNECLHGVGRNGRATVFPQVIGLGATFDRDLVHRVATAISDEARAKHHEAVRRGSRKQYQGLTFWTPNINIFRDPRWGRGQETYGEDPYLMGEMGVQFIKGLQGDNPDRMKAAACAKHYAVHSGPESERHTFNAVVSKKDLRETYLPAFKKAVDVGVEAVMGAYNRTLDEPCCASQLLMGDILRGEWDFQGHYVSDCGAIGDFHKHHKVTMNQQESAALAVKHGCDINCGGVYQALLQAVKEGLVSEEEVDACVRRAMRARLKLGLLDPNDYGPYSDIPLSVVDCEEHRKLAYEAAVKSCVLLKNDGILPLKPDLGKVFLTGPHAADIMVLLGNYYGMNPRMVTILEGVVDRLPEGMAFEYRQGRDPDREKVNPQDWAVGDAAHADVVIAVMGVDPLMEGEEGEAIRANYCGDREQIELPPHQVDFIRDLSSNGKPVVVVLTGGSPMAVPEIHEMAAAVLQVWYPGEEGGNAVADILFGHAEPTGRLPVTFPKATKDLPPFGDYNMQGRTYRYMEKESLYPFGFGLGYAKVEYSDLKLSTDTVEAGDALDIVITAKNTSDRATEAVTQVYIKDLEASVVVPRFSLAQFARTPLAANEEKRLTLTIPAEAMQIVNDDGEFVYEPGEFEIYVGGVSPDERNLLIGSEKWVDSIFNLIT